MTHLFIYFLLPGHTRTSRSRIFSSSCTMSVSFMLATDDIKRCTSDEISSCDFTSLARP